MSTTSFFSLLLVKWREGRQTWPFRGGRRTFQDWLSKELRTSLCWNCAAALCEIATHSSSCRRRRFVDVQLDQRSKLLLQPSLVTSAIKVAASNSAPSQKRDDRYWSSFFFFLVSRQWNCSAKVKKETLIASAAAIRAVHCTVKDQVFWESQINKPEKNNETSRMRKKTLSTFYRERGAIKM